MIVFSTVLFVNGDPVVYKVYKNRQKAFLTPATLYCAPILQATAREKTWQVTGSSDDRLITQALREISTS